MKQPEGVRPIISMHWLCQTMSFQLYVFSTFKSGRKFAWNPLPAMATVNLKIFPIHGPDFGAGGQFGHAHDAGVGEIHFAVAVFPEELQKIRVLFRYRKIQDQIPTANQQQTGHAGPEQEGQFDQHRFTGPKWRMCPQLLRSPWVVSVVEVQCCLEKPGISNPSHEDVL